MNPLFPKFTISAQMLSRIAEICERLGVMRGVAGRNQLHLRRVNQIKTVQASLQIEGNLLTLAQVTAILDGKAVLAPAKDIQEVRNAIVAYQKMPDWLPDSEADLLAAHRVLMTGLLDAPGQFRHNQVGIQREGETIHVAPPAHMVPQLMTQLFQHLAQLDLHPILKSCIFHYEFEYIHPFPDGNGRLGRLWQTLMLGKFNPVFFNLPVESIIRDRQQEYYQSLNLSNQNVSCEPFVEFMLIAILDALKTTDNDQVNDQVSDQVKQLCKVLKNQELSAIELMKKLHLSHRPTFRHNYLHPALNAGLIEYTIPDKPNSRNQKYRMKRI